MANFAPLHFVVNSCLGKTHHSGDSMAFRKIHFLVLNLGRWLIRLSHFRAVVA